MPTTSCANPHPHGVVFAGGRYGAHTILYKLDLLKLHWNTFHSSPARLLPPSAPNFFFWNKPLACTALSLHQTRIGRTDRLPGPRGLCSTPYSHSRMPEPCSATSLRWRQLGQRLSSDVCMYRRGVQNAGSTSLKLAICAQHVSTVDLSTQKFTNV